ncbi:MAG: hypothetical protein HQK53_02535 [Oligoflexia bacterium]|nr:hypothetical protein [Oligoflexia bacterium]
MDIHWYFSLHDAFELAKKIKSFNHNIPIVVGGYTATIFANEIINHSCIDYVLMGDGESIFSALILALIEKKTLCDFENLSYIGHKGKIISTLKQKDYDQSDCLTIDWFPSLKKIVNYHQKNTFPTFIYPFIPIFKGCNYPCKGCYGSVENQEAIFGRPRITRSAFSIKNDLRKLSFDKKVSLVYMMADFAAFETDDFTRTVLNEKYDLALYYEFWHVPSKEILNQFITSFKSLHLVFTTRGYDQKKLKKLFAVIDSIKSSSDRKNTITLHVQTKRAAQIAYPLLYFWIRHPYVELLNINFCDLNVPDPKVLEKAQEFNKFFTKSKKRYDVLLLIRELIVKISFFNKYLTFLLRRIHTLQILLILLFLFKAGTRAKEVAKS